ncbi:12048_t:CDS:1, partial [Entrophospora sp. SA101]
NQLSEPLVNHDGVFADHDPQRLNEKCLVCPQPKAEGFYCSEHAQTIKTSHGAWQ